MDIQKKNQIPDIDCNIPNIDVVHMEIALPEKDIQLYLHNEHHQK